jgi:hypothetical protein
MVLPHGLSPGEVVSARADIERDAEAKPTSTWCWTSVESGDLLLVSPVSNEGRVHPVWVMEIAARRSMIGIGQCRVKASG